jgi:hypothetical protein
MKSMRPTPEFEHRLDDIMRKTLTIRGVLWERLVEMKKRLSEGE